jgi:hypothetical protein
MGSSVIVGRCPVLDDFQAERIRITVDRQHGQETLPRKWERLWTQERKRQGSGA